MSSNIWYYPEENGLEVLFSYDSAAAHEFHLLVVWRKLSTGEILYCYDSGCSCPSPFEGLKADDLYVIRDMRDYLSFTNYVDQVFSMEREDNEVRIRLYELKRDVFALIKENKVN